MNKLSIRLLLSLALATAAVSAGWTPASSDSRTAQTADASSLGSSRTPGLTPYSGDPDPGSAPVPKLIASRDQNYGSAHSTLSWFRWAGRVLAAWYLRSAW